MRIALVINADLPGVGRTALVRYAVALRRLGHDVTVLCTGTTGDLPFPVLTPPAEVAASRRRFLGWTIRTLRSLRADVNHLFFSRGMTVVARAVGLPGTVVDVRSVSLGDGTKDKLARAVTRIELALAPSNIATIDPGIERLLFGPLPLRSIGTTSIGAESNADRAVEPADWARPALRPDVIDLVMVGSLHPVRRLDRLIDGFDRTGPAATGLRLWLVGDGPDRHALAEQVRRRALCDFVRFTGLVPPESVIASLPYFDVGLAYVPTTHFFDHQPPLKTIEYLAAGLPVIATDTAVHRRILTGADRHLLIDDRPEAVAEALHRMAGRHRQATSPAPQPGTTPGTVPGTTPGASTLVEIDVGRSTDPALHHARSWDQIAVEQLEPLYAAIGARHG